jgi:hypothetical protein
MWEIYQNLLKYSYLDNGVNFYRSIAWRLCYIKIALSKNRQSRSRNGGNNNEA